MCLYIFKRNLFMRILLWNVCALSWCGAWPISSSVRELGRGDVATPTVLPGVEKEINKPGQPKMINSDSTRKEMIPVANLVRDFTGRLYKLKMYPFSQSLGNKPYPSNSGAGGGPRGSYTNTLPGLNWNYSSNTEKPSWIINWWLAAENPDDQGWNVETA